MRVNQPDQEPLEPQGGGDLLQCGGPPGLGPDNAHQRHRSHPAALPSRGQV